MLTSQAREALRGVETVILDEVHAVAGTKRGAHLALSPGAAGRAARPAGPADRAVGDRPAGGGGGAVPRPAAPGRRRAAAVRKEFDLSVVVPVEPTSAAHRPSRTGDAAAGPGGRRRRAPASIWPHVEERIVDLVEPHRSTIVFANSRRLAERLTARLNEIWHERLRAQAASRRRHAPGSSRGGAPRTPPS